MTPPAVKVNPRVQAIRERTGHGLSVQETMDAANDIVGGQNVELQKEQEETKGYVVAEPTLKKVLAILIAGIMKECFGSTCLLIF